MVLGTARKIVSEEANGVDSGSKHLAIIGGGKRIAQEAKGSRNRGRGEAKGKRCHLTRRGLVARRACVYGGSWVALGWLRR